MNAPLERARPESCLSDLYLDRLLAGEVSDPEPGKTHLRSCQLCAERLAAIEADREAFERDAPRLALPAPVRTPRRSWVWPVAGAATVAVAAAAVLLVLPGEEQPSQESSGVRRKGGERIGVFVKHGQAVRQGASGEVVQPGDSLRFSYATDEPSYLALISVDGADRVTVYFPHAGTAQAVEPGRDVALPGSTILDDTLGSETIYGLFCNHAAELEPVRAAFAASPREPPIPEGCVVDRLLIEKRLLP